MNRIATLPPEATSSSGLPARSPLDSRPPRILIIDDTAAIHADFRKILSEVDEPVPDLDQVVSFEVTPPARSRVRFQLDSAFQGQEGLALLQRAQAEGRPYPLAIVDARMPPGWDGVETASQLWAVDPHLQIVLCTAYSDYSWPQIVSRLGQTDNLVILKKPFDPIEILQLTQALTRKWELARESRECLATLNAAVWQRTRELRAADEKLLQEAAERGRAAEALAESRRVFRTILDTLPDPVWLKDTQGRFLVGNAALSAFCGRPLEDVVGKTVFELIPQQAEQLAKEDAAVIQSGRSLCVEEEVTNGQGQTIWFETIKSPMLSAAGAVTGTVGIARDITQRKHAELRLSAFSTLGHRLSAAQDAKEAARIIAQVADELIGWDAFLCYLYSVEKDLTFDILNIDVINGRRTECATHAECGPPSALGRRAITQGGQLILREGPPRPPSEGLPFGDRTRASASILYVPMHHNGRVRGLLSIQSYTPHAYDQRSLETLQALADHCGGAFERIHAETALMAAQEQLRQSQKMEAIGKLAGGVAHDFNNLLGVIRGNIELALLSHPQLPLETRENLNEVATATERAANLTRQLLTFSRKQVMQSRPIDLNEVVANLTRMLKRIIGENIQLQCSYGARLPLTQADVGMLEQALTNLIVNARDAMPTGGQLLITTSSLRVDEAYLQTHAEARLGEFVCLGVTDSGSGIAAQHLSHLFEPFFTTKEPGKGTGLGLPIVYGIVQQHQGWIEVSSQLGKGSTFKLFLPATHLAAPAPAAAAPEPPLPGGQERILVVEDDAPLRTFTRRLLERFGYRVSEAPSGQAALEQWRHKPLEIDLLLTDIIMPGGVTGRALAEQLRTVRPSLKVLYMSGYSGQVLGDPAAPLPPAQDRLLHKPCPARELLTAVRQVLDEECR